MWALPGFNQPRALEGVEWWFENGAGVYLLKQKQNILQFSLTQTCRFPSHEGGR